MLTEEEELRLASCIDVAKADVAAGTSFYIEPKTALWLAEKLRETNNELAQVHEELRKTNESYANYVETRE